MAARLIGGLRRRVAARRGRAPRRPAVEPTDDRRLLFVVGQAKSGTSWLMGILDSHPEVFCRGEGRFFGREHRLGAARSRSLERALADSDRLLEWARGSVWARRAELEEPSTELSGAIARHLMLTDPAAAAARVVGDKTPLNGTGVVASIGAACPGSRIVQIVRDGRDVCVSSVHHVWNQADPGGGRPRALSTEQAEIRNSYRADPAGHLAAGRSLFAAGQLEELAREWAELTAAAIAEGRVLPDGTYVEVRYERLLDSGPRELARVCELLGVDASQSVLCDCLERNSFERLTAGRRPGSEDSTAFLRSGVQGDWRRVFNPEDREAFKRAAGTTLVELGYEPDGGW